MSSGRFDAYLAGARGDDELVGGPSPDTLVGGDGDDLLRGGAGADHIDGGFGVDAIDAEDGDDLVLGGPANDAIDLGAGNDELDAGSGDDTVACGDGNDRARGGPGYDTMRGDEGDDRLFGAAGSDSLHGGAGSDYLVGGGGDDELLGEDGDDQLRPGPGKDTARGGAGNDTIFVEGPCEISAGELLDGGPGDDTLLTSMTLEQLAEQNVKVVDIETVRSVGPRPGICEQHDPSRRMVELTGVAVDAKSLWRDRKTELWFAPDGKEHDAEVWTRTRVRVDGAYDATVVPGSDVYVFSVGGAIDFDDGSGVATEACGIPEPELGSRYRLRLVELRDGSGAVVGFEQEAYVSSVFNVGLFFWLPDAGPIPPVYPRSVTLHR